VKICQNGKKRTAPVVPQMAVIYIKKNETHGHYSEAHKLAEQVALTLPRATAFPYQDTH
jgi:hypothetical protein